MPSKQAVEELVRGLYNLGAVRREISRHALAELGSQGFTALAVIYTRGPLRVSEVAAELAVDISVASRQIAALSNAGYIERETDADDRRAHVVRTSEAGVRALRESHRRMVHAVEQALRGWSTDDVRDLAHGLARLASDFSTTTAAGAVTEVGR